MRRFRSYGVVIAVMLGFAQAAVAGEQFPQVLVTVAPLKPYVDAILKGAGASQGLLRPGQDPHTFTLAPSQARILDDAEILIVPDMGMSPLFARTLATKKKIRVIELSKLTGANPLPYLDENPWIAKVKEKGHESEDEDDHAHAAPDSKAKKTSAAAAPSIDPHFWLDPERMAAIAVPLAEAIAESSPEHRAELVSNAQTLAKHLRMDVIPAMKELLAPDGRTTYPYTKPQIPFITYHAAYQYFLARFGLSHAGEITARPEDYIGAKTLDSLLTTAKTVHVNCIIGEMDTTLVRRIAKMSEARVVILSPEQMVEKNTVPPLDWIENDYDRLLYKTAKSFGECLAH